MSWVRQSTRLFDLRQGALSPSASATTHTFTQEPLESSEVAVVDKKLDGKETGIMSLARRVEAKTFHVDGESKRLAALRENCALQPVTPRSSQIVESSRNSLWLVALDAGSNSVDGQGHSGR